jgi:hypothetical protein
MRKPYHLTESGGQPRRYCTYELLCGCRVPIYVGWGLAPAPWAALWAVRQYLPTPFGRFLQSLDARPPLGHWRVGFLTPISRASAIALCDYRVQELRGMGIDPDFNPPKVKGRWIKVIRVWPDGRCERYSNLTAAAKAVGLSRRQAGRYLDSGQPDDTGAIWAAW